MFDIGWSEMLVIGVVALIVIGPKELPGVIRTVGKTVGRLRRMAGEFQGQFQEALREADLADVKKTLSGLADDTQSSIAGVRDSVAAAIPTNPLHDIEQQLKDAAQPVERKDLPAPADPSSPPPATSGPTELEPNAFETIENEVRTAVEALAEAEPAPVATADPVPGEPEIARAVADLDRPATVPAPASPAATSSAELSPVGPSPLGEPEVARAVADLDGAPVPVDAHEARTAEVRGEASPATPAGEAGPKAKGADAKDAEA